MEAIVDASTAVLTATSRKRYAAEIPLEKTIFILVNSRLGTSVAGMFKFNIKITSNTNDSCIGNEKKQASSLLGVVWAGEGEGETETDHLLLKPVKSFFNQDPYDPIVRVAYCQFRGSPEELYLIPEDARISNRNSVSPFIFNFKTNTTTPFSLPLQKKWDPIAAAVGASVYVLATGSEYGSPEPRFEEYYPALSEWTYLPKIPYTSWNSYISGYAVLKDKFVVVCICAGYTNESVFYSYNTMSGEWKHVKQRPHDDCPHATKAKIDFDSALIGEGVVLFDSCDDPFGIIYSYNSQSTVLLRFCYTVETFNSEGPLYYDLSLGPACVVEGFQVLRLPASYVGERPFINESGVIAKVDYNILCVLHGVSDLSAENVMKVSGSIIQIHDDDSASCTILKTFNCGLILGELLTEADIKSCLILQLEQQKDGRPWKRLKDDCNSILEDATEMEVN